MQFYFFVGKGKTRVDGSVNHGIKNLSPYWLERDNVHILKASSYFAFLFRYKNITQAVLFKSIRGDGGGGTLFLRVAYNVKKLT